ncbi:Uncharacterised protein [Vibrio cholerae]|nr:Uncharacterised protein [Vibrio cholerae]
MFDALINGLNIAITASGINMPYSACTKRLSG